MNLEQLRAAIQALLAEARAITDGAENGQLSAEQSQRHDEIMAQIDEHQAQVDRILAQNQRQVSFEQIEVRANEPQRPARRPAPDANLGMNRREVQQYSLVRAIRAAMNNDWRGAELEREASEATAKRLGREPNGAFFVPADWMERRDLLVGTNTAGGHTVATDLLAQSFIDLLRNRMILTEAGVTMLTGLVGNVAIPRQTGGATAYWVAENGAPTESQQAFDQVTMSPKTVGAFTDISRRLINQSSIDVESLVRQDLATVLALAIDLAGLHGSGSSNQPTGLAATSGIGSVAGGTNGAAPTQAHLIALETEVAQDNADVGRLGYVTNTKVRGKLKTTPKVASTDSVMVWPDGVTPTLNGYRALVSNQVSSALTKGSASGVCSAIFFGNWADLLVGMWGGLDIMVDPYTGGTAGTVRVIALQDVDVAVRHPESFAAMLDVLTS